MYLCGIVSSPVRPGTSCARDETSASCVLARNRKDVMIMTKRIVSLLMAIMLVIGVFAIQAAATSPDDGIEPYAEWTHCSSCGASVRVDSYQTTENVRQTCKEPYGIHIHHKTYQCKSYSCSCGNYELISKVCIGDDCWG